MKKYSIRELYEYDHSMIDVIEREDGIIQYPSGKVFLDKYHCTLEYISDKVNYTLPFFVPFTQYSSISEIYDAYGKALEVYYRLCYDKHPYSTIQMYIFAHAIDVTYGTTKRFKAIDRYTNNGFEFNDFKEFVDHEYYELEKYAIENIFNCYENYSEELIQYISKLRDRKFNLQNLYKTLSSNIDVLYQIDISPLYLILNFNTLDILDAPDYQDRIVQRIKELGDYCSEEYLFPDEEFK
ncbi:hypothetical protein [[Clostridium] innocuum]|uniref:hypothetical protein n=1 Tax=Clostridium innocuum TaxID=1522 RepID=UPI001AF098F7|nr:hypothetical protein [[Clostridium] innocuum]MDU1018768.1 hypothetical protein [Bifidobacterium breve]QSI26865.1 hypothetical protein GKZ87_15925 [Erysipelotrichaceae bacterium 66202529]MCC2831831.1 hypothetical protein [[Clostridium] innocuum]MCR0248547.1 hypothetical protein [[Clostridium] innocuum]MCR0261058.1 hypothetical protein [[Clostridium] innocuum]